MIDIDETEKQVKLLQSKSFIRMQLDLPEVLELIERVRRAENARDGWASYAMECANAITGAEVLLARIAEVAKLHQPESFHDEPIESFCKTCQRTSGVWPCGTAIALGLNEGENTDV